MYYVIFRYLSQRDRTTREEFKCARTMQKDWRTGTWINGLVIPGRVPSKWTGV